MGPEVSAPAGHGAGRPHRGGRPPVGAEPATGQPDRDAGVRPRPAVRRRPAAAAGGRQPRLARAGVERRHRLRPGRHRCGYRRATARAPARPRPPTPPPPAASCRRRSRRRRRSAASASRPARRRTRWRRRAWPASRATTSAPPTRVCRKDEIAILFYFDGLHQRHRHVPGHGAADPTASTSTCSTRRRRTSTSTSGCCAAGSATSTTGSRPTTGSCTSTSTTPRSGDAGGPPGRRRRHLRQGQAVRRHQLRPGERRRLPRQHGQAGRAELRLLRRPVGVVLRHLSQARSGATCRRSRCRPGSTRATCAPRWCRTR